MSTLAADFAAMVAELRPRWRAQDQRRSAATRAWLAASAAQLPARRPLTVDDYRARLARYDSTAYLSDDRSVANEGYHERDALTAMARQFDPDFAIWHEVVNRRANPNREGAGEARDE